MKGIKENDWKGERSPKEIQRGLMQIKDILKRKGRKLKKFTMKSGIKVKSTLEGTPKRDTPTIGV